MATDDDFETHHNEYLAKQREKVKDALQDRHASKILDFVYDRHELKNEGDDDHLAASTARNYLRELRYLMQFTYDSERFEAEPDNWDADDWNKLSEPSHETEASVTERNAIPATPPALTVSGQLTPSSTT